MLSLEVLIGVMIRRDQLTRRKKRNSGGSYKNFQLDNKLYELDINKALNLSEIS